MNKIQYNGLHHDILLSLLLLFAIFKCYCISIVLSLTAVFNAADLMLAVVFNSAHSLETFDDVTIRGRHVLQALRVLRVSFALAILNFITEFFYNEPRMLHDGANQVALRHSLHLTTNFLSKFDARPSSLELCSF